MGIKFTKEDSSKCTINSNYPNLIDLYYDEIGGRNYRLAASNRLGETLRYLKNNDPQMVGNLFERALGSYLSNFVGSSKDAIPGSRCEFNDLKYVKYIDKFDIFKSNNHNLIPIQLYEGVFFTNKTFNHEYIDGGFIFLNSNPIFQKNFDLVTYDVTISDKSDKMLKTVENINEKVNQFQNVIQHLLKGEPNSIKINFRKHYYIVGVGLEDSESMKNDFDSKKLNDINENLSKRLLKYKNSLIFEEFRNKIGILSAKITKERSDDQKSEILGLKLEEITI